MKSRPFEKRNVKRYRATGTVRELYVGQRMNRLLLGPALSRFVLARLAPFPSLQFVENEP